MVFLSDCRLQSEVLQLVGRVVFLSFVPGKKQPQVAVWNEEHAIARVSQDVRTSWSSLEYTEYSSCFGQQSANPKNSRHKKH